MDRRKQFFKIIQDDINAGGKLFGTKIAKEFRLEDWNQALESVDKYADQGKVLLSIEEKA